MRAGRFIVPYTLALPYIFNRILKIICQNLTDKKYIAGPTVLLTILLNNMNILNSVGAEKTCNITVSKIVHN